MEENTGLYGFRERLTKNREHLKSHEQKYLQLEEKMDKLTNTHDELDKKINSVVEKQGELYVLLYKIQSDLLTYDSVKETINDWSNAELQPVLNELCDDMENVMSEVKLLKQKQLNSFNSFTKMESDLDTQSVQSIQIKPSPQVKHLTLQKKTRM